MGKRAEETNHRMMLDTIEEMTGKSLAPNRRQLIEHGSDEEDLVRSGLEDAMVNAYSSIRDAMRRKPAIRDLRTAAFYLAIEKIGSSYGTLGIFP